MCVCLGTNTWAKIQQWHILFSFLEGFLWAEIKQMWDSGFEDYIDDWWNLMDFIMNSLYLATISLKIVAYIKVIYIKGFYLSVCFIYYFVLEQASCRKNWHCVLSILSMFDYCSFFSTVQCKVPVERHLGNVAPNVGGRGIVFHRQHFQLLASH